MRTKHQAKKLAKQLTASRNSGGRPARQPVAARRDRNLAAFVRRRPRARRDRHRRARRPRRRHRLVVHVDPPVEHKAYLHRSGRTARAGSEGDVVTVVLPRSAARSGPPWPGLRRGSARAGLGPGHLVAALVGEPRRTSLRSLSRSWRSGRVHGRPAAGPPTAARRRTARRLTPRPPLSGSGQGGSGQGNGAGAGSQTSPRRPARRNRQLAAGAKRHGQSGSASASNSGSKQRFTTGSTVADIQRSARTPRRARG